MDSQIFATRPHASQAVLEQKTRIAIYDQLWHRHCPCKNKRHHFIHGTTPDGHRSRYHIAYSRIFTNKETARLILTAHPEWIQRQRSSISRKDSGLIEILAIGWTAGLVLFYLRLL